MVGTKSTGSALQERSGHWSSGATGGETGQLRLDPSNLCVWRGEEAVSLTPKAFAVLRYLVEHPRRLVGKQELLDAIWPSTYVGDAVLKVGVLEIRKALRDSHVAPRFIATVHRSGYRFLGGIVMAAAPEPGLASFVCDATAPAPEPRLAVPLAGRTAALDRLDELLAAAVAGERQIAFVTGEQGIGKTSVVDAFLARSPSAGAAWVLRGQCLRQYGPGEDYRPVLEGLSRLCREPGREQLVDLLRRQAPTWLVQMPWLLASGEREALQRDAYGVAKERMLREMAETLEAITAVVPLVLVLEDLHWSDPMTLDLLAALARRRQPARLLVVGTYRPTDVAAGENSVRSLAQDLTLQRLGEALPLPPLSEHDVAAYLRLRFDDETRAAALATLVHRRSDGNPLLVASLVDHLVARGAIAQVDAATVAGAVPDCLRAMIEKRVERLAVSDRQLLEAASVAGVEFAGIALAAPLEADPVEVEERCELLARRGEFLAAAGVAELADGSLAGRYRFRHALYRDVLAERLSPRRRLRLLQRTEPVKQQARLREGEAAGGELAASLANGRDRVRSSYTRRRGVTASVKPIARLSAL